MKKYAGSDLMVKYALNATKFELFLKLSTNNYDQQLIEELDFTFALYGYKLLDISLTEFDKHIGPHLSKLPTSNKELFLSLFPDSEFSKLHKYEREAQDIFENLNVTAKKISKRGWIEIFNRFWAIVDRKEGHRATIHEQYPNGTYISGPTFFRILHDLQPYLPNYNQTRSLAEQNEDTWRINMFQKVFDELDEKDRTDFYQVFLNKLTEIPSAPRTEINSLYSLLEGNKLAYNEHSSDNTKHEEGLPRIFISYSWDSANHKDWVRKLAEDITQYGFNVRIDANIFKLGNNLPYLMEQEVKEAWKVLIICSDGYKIKADTRIGGVGFEYSLVLAELYKDQKNSNEKFIPIIRGSFISSVPDFLQQINGIDFNIDSNYEKQLIQLIESLETQ